MNNNYPQRLTKSSVTREKKVRFADERDVPSWDITRLPPPTTKKVRFYEDALGIPRSQSWERLSEQPSEKLSRHPSQRPSGPVSERVRYRERKISHVREIPLPKECMSINSSVLPSPTLSEASTYDVFISHARPEKFNLAMPLHSYLSNISINPFLDVENLPTTVHEAPSAMTRAIRGARVGIFLLSPEFVAKKWPMKELGLFLQRYKEESRAERPKLIPVFYKLSIDECTRVFEDDSPYREVLERHGFFTEERQRKCSTEQARDLMSAIVKHSGVEAEYMRDGGQKGDAVIVQDVIDHVKRFLERERDVYNH